MADKSNYVDKVKEKLEEFKFKSPKQAKNPKLVEKKLKEVDKKEVKKEEKKKESGKKKGPGIPDGTGPCSETESCPMKNKKESIVAKVMKKLAKDGKKK